MFASRYFFYILVINSIVEVLLKLSNDLTALSGNGQIEDFHIGADGKPYITYKVGADTVTKKLGSVGVIPFSLSTSTVSNSCISNFVVNNSSHAIKSITIKTAQALDGQIRWNVNGSSSLNTPINTENSDLINIQIQHIDTGTTHNGVKITGEIEI